MTDSPHNQPVHQAGSTPAISLSPLTASAEDILAGDSVRGQVVDSDGHGVSGIYVDLFSPNRESWLGYAMSDEEGNVSFDAKAGCYVLTFWSTEVTFGESGSHYLNRDTCGDHTVIATANTNPAILKGVVSHNGYKIRTGSKSLKLVLTVKRASISAASEPSPTSKQT